MKRKLGVAAGVLVALLGSAYAWFFVASEEADGRWPLELTEVRKAASTLEGEKPTEVRVEKVATFSFPKGLVVTGAGWHAFPMACFAYQLVFPTGTAIIDTCMDEATAREGLPVETYDAAAWQRVQAALGRADFSVATHEHYDHLGGAMVNATAWERAIVNREQLEHPELVKPLTYPTVKPKRVLDYQGITAIAPGVVLIRAPGHTPGSQLVYVQLQSGAEVLFLGDVAWAAENVERVRERPRGATAVMNEDRRAVLQQLAALNALEQSEPKVAQVPGHDVGALDGLVAAGVMKVGFVLPTP
ncbi:MAG: MBL fold metallo-hydrolase [Myxococcaceae bacterium]|nr:MBL fold metallo-hydrolase [Myxococcaceae bacterium]